MPRTLVRLWLMMGIVTLGLWFFGAPVTADPADTIPPDPLNGTPVRGVYLRAPQGGLPTGKPVQVLLALHGMGGNGQDFAKDLLDQADRYGWLVVAPTIEYGDWTNPDVVASEDPLLIQTLNAYLDGLPQIVGVPIRHLVLILGHSRGAQLAHRFAEFRPDRVLAIAALSAGTYTMPQTSGAQGSLNFPYGVQDLDQYAGHPFDATRFDSVGIWVGVGGLDTNANEVPRQWDSVEGTTRVQRAQAFETAARQLGANTVLRVFNNAGHGLTGEMRSAACEFLQGSVGAQNARRDLYAVDNAPN
jgi:pimeloyl-ACP methyl ester carboxylesterase